MAIALLTVFFSARISAQQKKVFLGTEKIWDKQIPCEIFLEIKNLISHDDVHHTILNCNMDYRETSYIDSSIPTGKDYVLSDVNFEESKHNLSSILSNLNDEGWNTLSFANRYLNLNIDAYKISLSYGVEPGNIIRKIFQSAISNR